jgi:hypothetical protein
MPMYLLISRKPIFSLYYKKYNEICDRIAGHSFSKIGGIAIKHTHRQYLNLLFCKASSKSMEALTISAEMGRVGFYL